MREIKFRGKSVETGRWVYGYFCMEHQTPCIRYTSGATSFSREVDSKTVGQFTGMTDKSNQGVFEGDIVFDADNDENWIVVYDSIHAMFGLKYPDGKEDGCCFSLCGVESNEIEIIGNIHDNPELLETD